jgi:hypothetical protein
MKKVLIFIGLIFLFLGCDKSELKWDLEKVGRLPIVITSSATDITNVSAMLGGEVTYVGSEHSLLRRGICYASTSNPTIDGLVVVSGDGIGTYDSQITGLVSNTTYYVRAFAENSVGIAYGSEVIFTTTNVIAKLSELTTRQATSITVSTAVSGGDIGSDGGSAVTNRGVCYSASQNPTISNNVINSGSGLGAFTTNLTGLNASTTYYVRAFATNAVGTSYGNQVSFSTTDVPAKLSELTTRQATSITVSTAVSGGDIASDGGSAVTNRGVCYSASQNPTISNNVINSGSGLGAFTTNLTGLNASTTYYARAFATNAVGNSYGNQVSFSTSSPPAATIVGSNNCSSLGGISSLYYGINGTSASWGLTTSGYVGNCWRAPDPNNSGNLSLAVGNHYVQFNRNFNSKGYLEFWVNTSNPGASNLIPVIVVNGAAIGNATMIGGQTSSFYWMKVRTPEISAGNNTIKILISSSYYVLSIDEIDFFEY